MVVAMIALVFAVAGTSVAGVATISVLSKKEKQQTRSIAKSEINKAAPGLSVANAVNAQRAATADTANAPQGVDNPELRILLRNRCHRRNLESTLFVESDNEAEGAGVLVCNDSSQVTVIELRLFVEWLSDNAFCEIAGQATTTG